MIALQHVIESGHRVGSACHMASSHVRSLYWLRLIRVSHKMRPAFVSRSQSQKMDLDDEEFQIEPPLELQPEPTIMEARFDPCGITWRRHPPLWLQYVQLPTGGNLEQVWIHDCVHRCSHAFAYWKKDSRMYLFDACGKSDNDFKNWAKVPDHLWEDGMALTKMRGEKQECEKIVPQRQWRNYVRMCTGDLEHFSLFKCPHGCSHAFAHWPQKNLMYLFEPMKEKWEKVPSNLWEDPDAWFKMSF